MSKHWRFGGSTAQRTMNCAAWLRLSEEMDRGPVQVSDAATQGTVLHEALECRFTGEPERTLAWAQRLDISPEELQDLIEDKVTPAHDRVNELFDAHEVTEFEVELAMQHPTLEDVGGTADLLALGDAILCLDYKSGDGVYVDEGKGHDQLMFYAWLAWLDEYWGADFKSSGKVVIGVVQPHRGKLLSWTQEVSLSQLTDWAAAFTAQRDDALNGNPEPNPGEWCRFCPAAAVCPSKTALAKRVKHLKLETRAQLGKALDMAEELDAWIRDVRTLATEQLENGASVPGYKLVAKRGSRRWTDTEAVEAAVEGWVDEPYDKKLKSPAQMEKVCKKEGVDFHKLEEYITSHSTGTTLAHESDPRPAVLPIAHLELVAKTTKH